jgi:hypothetical protein
MAEKTLFIFDIENIKGHYSRCLELIMSLEQNDLQKIKGALNRFNEIKTNSVRFFSSSDNIPTPRVIENEVFPKSHTFNISSNSGNDPQNTKYHIRIKSNNTLEYSNLQYLALLLKRLEYMTEANPASQEHRLTVFFSGSYSFYNDLSLYLRLLAKRAIGTIFAEDEKGEVSAIDFKKYVGKSDFIPLIPIDLYSYNELTKPIASFTFNQLFDMRIGGRFGESRDINSKNALPDFLIEVSYYKLNEVYENEKEILEEIKTHLNESTITLMHFLIFALLNKRYSSKIFINKKVNADYFNIVYTLAEDIYIGIRQIIENVIQHSETKSGFLQLLLRKQDTNQFLEVSVSDLNKEETLVDNFKKKLECEKEGEPQLSTVCEILLCLSEKMNISDFFTDAEDVGFKNAWDEYRKEIGMRHFGLRIFNDTLLSCKSYFQIVSNTNYKFDKKTLYSSGKNREYDDDDLIPGTEVFASIPLLEKKKKKDVFSSAQLNYFDETYECFANFLDYQAEDKTKEIFEIFLQNRKSRGTDFDFNIESPALKEEFTEIWAASFNQLKKQIKKDELLYINLDGYFNDSQDINNFGNSEVFSRGIFRGLLLRESHDKSYIAIINADNVRNDVMSQIKVRGGFRDTNIDSSIQLFLHIKSSGRSFTLFGDTVQKAIQNAFILSLEHGLGLFEHEDLYPLNGTKNDMLNSITPEDVKVMPFDVLVTENKNEKMSIFDKKIKIAANKKIDDNENTDAGYLIENSHMRLGSKIHIDGFFEMSFLFYRTSIANRIAFEIIQNIKNNGIDIKKDKLLFYGYASYSKAIITSLVEILNEYRENSEKVRFVVYQHNLQTETSNEEIQLFDGHEDNLYLIPSGTHIIQIVPISSTLTTFYKMWDKFIEKYSESKTNIWLKEYDPVLNYTVFWVYDESFTEGSDYIEKTDFLNQKIKTFKNLVKNDIQFLISSPLKWHLPLGCDKCFPQNLIEEEILVETDKTSTVPTQQLRLKKYKSLRLTLDKEKERERNNRVLLLLLKSKCIKYGHILRGKNHFQYYINTQEFFYKAQKDIKGWLGELKTKFQPDKSKLNIIFVPEHNTNVGFAQFVNIYCFNGTAEVISINIDKEYRTNFICEHKAIKAANKILLDFWNQKEENDKCTVKFYFVDDSIITGGTFNRANDLLLSLLPQEEIKYFPTIIFSKIFVLVDRLSENSKNAYVKEPEKNFHTFLHIDISSMRTNGDSCICCKLKSEAERLFAKSSTKKLAVYWYEKINSRDAVFFDKEDKNDPKAATFSLLISHIANNYLFKDNPSFTEDELLKLIEKLYDKFLSDENDVNNEDTSLFDDVFYDSILINNVKSESKNQIEIIKFLTKILSRPYFSFDSKFKQAVLRYLLTLADNILANTTKNKIVHIIQNINDEEKLNFFQNVILESLSDLKSTYFLRKETIKKIAGYIEKLNVDEEYIKEFYRCFAAFIHSAIDCGNDETKPLWFEYLLLFGEEYNEKTEGNSNFKTLYSSFFSNSNELNKTEVIFKKFCDELILMNSSILFKGIEICASAEKKKSAPKQDFDYFLNNWKKFRKIDKTQVNDMRSPILKREIKLFNNIDELNKHNNGNADKLLKERYENLFNQLTKTLERKYNPVVSNVSYALLTSYAQHTNNKLIKNNAISDFDIISMTGDKQVNPENSLKKYFIKEFICKKIVENDDLHNWGYIHDEINKDLVKIIIFFDNPKKHKKFEYYSKRELKNIAPVYLYIDIVFNTEISDDNPKEKYSLLILRDILMYRNRFMRALESDFSSEIFGQYAHKRDEANLIAHEKALSHATTYDDATEYKILVEKISENASLEEKKLKWIIFKSYVNRQISKLYCRSFNTEPKENEKITPLYIMGNEGYDQSSKKAFMYQPITNLRPLINDPRFELLRNIADFPDLDENKNNILDKKLYRDESGKNFNCEYLLCIIFDIIFTSIKYSIEICWKNKELIDIYFDTSNVKPKKPKIEFIIDNNYLVIKNPVILGNATANTTDYEDRNKIIEYRLENPIDFPDGRMSLGVIKKYIEGFDRKIMTQTPCSFKFIPEDEKSTIRGREGDRKRLYFETRIPIFDNAGENI